MRFVCFIIGILVSTAVTAQEVPQNENEEKKEEIKLTPQLVTVSKTSETPDEATSFITVTKSDSVVMWQAYRLSELLSLTPGVWVSDSGSFGYSTLASIRGTKPYHTVVLVDGVKVNDITLGSQFDLSDIDPYIIGKVEVLRGASSALYGSDSIGGVISIETETDIRKPSSFLSTEAGRYDTYGLRTGVSGTEGTATFSALAGTSHSHNAFRRYSFNRNSLASALKLSLPEDSSLKFVLRFCERENEFPFDYDYFTHRILNDENITQEHTTLIGAVQYERSFKTKFLSPQFALRTSFCLNSATFINGGDTDPTQPELETLNDALSLSAEPRLSLNYGETDRYKGFSLKTIIGAEWQKISTQSFSRYWNSWTSTIDSDYTNSSLSVYAVYVQTIFGYKRIRISAGARYDDYSNYGSDTSPRIGLLFDAIKERFIIRGSYGTGFRAPTPAEMFDPWVGNPALQAEHSTSFDFGFVVYPLPKRMRIELAYFNNNITDMIAYNPALPPFGKMDNFKEARIEGLELGLGYLVRKNISVEMAFTAQDARDTETKDELPAVSPCFGSISVAYKLSAQCEFGLTASASEATTEKPPEVNWLNTRGAERHDPGKKQIVNLFARWQPKEWAFISVKLENLLDDRFIATEMLPRSNGRSLSLSASLRF